MCQDTVCAAAVSVVLCCGSAHQGGPGCLHVFEEGLYAGVVQISRGIDLIDLSTFTAWSILVELV